MDYLNNIEFEEDLEEDLVDNYDPVDGNDGAKAKKEYLIKKEQAAPGTKVDNYPLAVLYISICGLMASMSNIGTDVLYDDLKWLSAF